MRTTGDVSVSGRRSEGEMQKSRTTGLVEVNRDACYQIDYDVQMQRDEMVIIYMAICTYMRRLVIEQGGM